uniref:ALS2 C-terminal like n=1 Tax=Sciurus vulgaris TaxID=55149 RepID=A0A8D2DS65_SCIVU
MCSPEEAALLRLEEVHSATLARINSLILQPLLSADPEPSEPQARECLRLLQELHRSSQELWEATEESLRSLWERQHHPHSIGLESLLLLRSPDRVLQVHMEYIESYTSCLVVQAFQKVAKRKSEYWRGQRKALRQLLTGMSSECSVGTTLAQALRQPLTQHVQQYVLLLLSLRDTIGERHPAKQLVMHAVTLFGNLQSFMGQALDQAVATQALWHTLSSRQRDVLCTPAHRLLQDSQDVPVTVTPLRAERVLLFDDALVLLQGHNVHTFDLKLLWVDPGQDRCMFHLLTPEEELSFCARDPQSQVVWQWKVTQAVCQALRGKKDFPVLGAGLEPAEPPACRCGSYTFRAEGRLCQATYEGEWFRGRPHGKGTLKWPNGRNHVGNFCEGLEQGFGIHLVPQAAEDKFDCYKCHWQEGSMCGYGICEYSSDEVYKGYFQDGLRHGFGVLDCAPQGPQPFRYTGHWEKGQRSGFGIQEDSDRGERYIGMWRADQRHGPGVVVTQAGVCYQGTFQVDKMVGPGVLLSEDDSLYEGAFTRDLTLVGKGKVTFPNGFTLEGSFSSGTGKGLYTQGVLDTAALPPDPSSTCKRQLGLGAFPVESRWQGVYSPFRDFVRAGCPGDLQEALLGFHVQSSRELRKSQEYLCCERSHPEDSAGSVEDILEELLQHREPETLQQYLRKVRALGWAAHGEARLPLGPAGEGSISHGRVLTGGDMGAAGRVALQLWVLSVPCLCTGPGSEQCAAPPGKAPPDTDADLPGLVCGRGGQQAPAGSGPGGGEAACPGTLGRLQGPPGAWTDAAPRAAQLLLGALHSLLASPREGGQSLQPGHRQPEPVSRHQAAGVPRCAEAPVATQGPQADDQSEVLSGQGQVLPVCHRVPAEDHDHGGPSGEAGGAGEDVWGNRDHRDAGAGPGAQAAHG